MEITLTTSNGDKNIATAPPSSTKPSVVEKRDLRIATEKSSDQMIVTWVIIAAVVVAVGAVVVTWLRTRQPRADPMSGLVVDALGADWADRTSADVQTVRSAALRGQPTQVRSQLAAMVDDVEVGFEFNGADPIYTSVRCRYADGTSATTTMDLPWERVPQEVRAQFLRNGNKKLSRNWSIS